MQHFHEQCQFVDTILNVGEWEKTKCFVYELVTRATVDHFCVTISFYHYRIMTISYFGFIHRVHLLFFFVCFLFCSCHSTLLLLTLSNLCFNIRIVNVQRRLLLRTKYQTDTLPVCKHLCTILLSISLFPSPSIASFIFIHVHNYSKLFI